MRPRGPILSRKGDRGAQSETWSSACTLLPTHTHNLFEGGQGKEEEPNRRRGTAGKGGKTTRGSAAARPTLTRDWGALLPKSLIKACAMDRHSLISDLIQSDQRICAVASGFAQTILLHPGAPFDPVPQLAHL